MIHEGFAQKQKTYNNTACFRESKNDISFAQKKNEHDTCNYVRHNHEFMLDF